MVVPLTAAQTHERARLLLQAGHGAALPELLRVIETLALNTCEVTVSDLSEIIEKDAVILAKILGVANTLYLNPGVARLESLSQAIHQLGYNRIRTLAVSLMLVRTANGEHNAPEQREAATRALCSGLIAQGAAEWLGTSDPEFVFACATLRDFGRIMVAAVSPPLCRVAAGRVPDVGDDEAHRESFGLTPLALGRDLLASAGLPPTVLATLRECEPESLRSAASTFDNRLLGLADFGARVAHLALDSRHPPADFVSRLKGLCQRYEPLVPGAGELARPALQRADDRIRSFACNLTVTLPSALKVDRLRWRIGQLADPADASAPPDGDQAPEREFPAAAQPVPAGQVSADLTQADTDWELLMAHSAHFEVPTAADPATTMGDALAGIAAALGADECWWFERPAGLSCYLPAGLLRPDSASLPATAGVEPAERSVFGVCAARREVVLIHDTAAANLRPYLPDWFRAAERPPAAFALIPLLETDAVAGLLLVGWAQPRRIALSVAEIAVARQSLAATFSREQPRAA